MAGQIHLGLICGVLAAVSGSSDQFCCQKSSAPFVWEGEEQFFWSKGSSLAHKHVHHIFSPEVIRGALARDKNYYCSQYLKGPIRIRNWWYFCLTTDEALCNVHNLEEKIHTANWIVVEDKGCKRNLRVHWCARVRLRAQSCRPQENWTMT